LQQWKSGNWVDCYRLVEILGRGTYGEVWKAEGIDGGLVAIKAMNMVNAVNKPYPNAALDALAEILAGEARVLRELTGKNLRVPKYVGKGEHHGRRYLVMECIEGRDLRSARMQPGNWDWRRCTEIVLSLLETVERLTSLSYYHYDIKPHNVILDPEDRAWVIDLGSAQSWEQMCARFLDPYPATSKDYAPPELLVGQDTQFTAQTGIYLVGGVLYYLLTGKHPKPKSEKAKENFETHKLTPQAPGELHPGLPEWLDALCLRMLAHNREDRPLNATAVIEEIRRELSAPPPTAAPLLAVDLGEHIRPTALSPAEPVRRGSRWAGWRIAILVALVGSCATLGLGAFSLLRDAGEPPFRLCALEDRVPVHTPGWVFQDPPRVWRDGAWVKHQGSWPTLIRLGHVKSISGALEAKLDLHVVGKVNAIGLGHTLEIVSGKDGGLPKAEFQLLCLRPGTVAEPPDRYSYRYAKFQITNPNPTQVDPNFLTLPGHLEQMTLEDQAPIPEVPFFIRNELPNLSLRLKIVNHYLTEVDINGATFFIDAASEKWPKLQGDVYLLIDSYISPNTTPADWGTVSTGELQTQILP
jgi:predicted Ser/Thr protein kinase